VSTPHDGAGAAPTAPQAIICSDQQQLNVPRWLAVLLAATTDLVHATSHGYHATCPRPQLQDLVDQYDSAPICDVCRATWPRWAHGRTTPTGPEATDDGSWLLCDACDTAKRACDTQILHARMRRANHSTAALAVLPAATVEAATTTAVQRVVTDAAGTRRPAPWLTPGAL